MSATAFGDAFTATSGEVKFTAVGKPGFLKIRGESKGKFPQGSIKLEKNAVSGDFEFDLKNLDTGIELRNEHMKNKYLEIEKFPTAKLVLKPITLKDGEMNTDMKKPFEGILTLHGVTKDVIGEFNFTSSNKSVEANFSIKVSDFKIDVPKYLGVTVSESVEIQVNAVLK